MKLLATRKLTAEEGRCVLEERWPEDIYRNVIRRKGSEETEEAKFSTYIFASGTDNTGAGETGGLTGTEVGTLLNENSGRRKMYKEATGR